mgnify:FL=1|tara:strand:- start:2631 stop:2846 length:216 start_codon:yes stop_codon:yes gene_type:complete
MIVSKMNFELDMEDYTIILNALHYYKKVEKKGNFQQYNDEKINALRDKLAKQTVQSKFSFEEYGDIINGNT